MKLSLVAPIITDEDGKIEDSYREFLTPVKLLQRIINSEDYCPRMESGVIYPDWIAGMFMLFKSEVYKSLGGFDEKYFMYCEDMDICFRAKINDHNFGVSRSQQIIHYARRDSKRKLQYLIWHVSSLLMFWREYYNQSPLSLFLPKN